MQSLIRLVLLGVALALSVPATAQDRELPYWASISAEEVYMRVGAGAQFPIKWVYRRKGLPVRVVRLMPGWRYVEEPDGTMGWISSSLLSASRTAIVTGEGLADMRAEPSDAADLRWTVEPGVVGVLGDCSEGWCEFDVEGHIGWVEERRLWGPGEP
ncbi:SH3 domain-containing protein [Aurantiacibacter poecillastricola]|uniref:SH3 domain-containing protein n=1 Tax=Aurantiacibacter poecillastricola TaxID=3064385 RepID=UPI00273E6527|nr:SH3 domain-containing protein [Aurantiacibacter sp. 219JJ12-13]MDP5262137.1 SH3 domain-containing protein [Aurantiacibacter sp. 219JJ12-13]